MKIKKLCFKFTIIGIVAKALKILLNLINYKKLSDFFNNKSILFINKLY